MQLLMPLLMILGFAGYYFYYKPAMAKASKNLSSGDIQNMYSALKRVPKPDFVSKVGLAGVPDEGQPVLLQVTTRGTLRLLENNGAGAAHEFAPKPRFELGGAVIQETEGVFGTKEEAYKMLSAAGKFENARIVTMHAPSGEAVKFWMSESNAAALMQWSQA